MQDPCERRASGVGRAASVSGAGQAAAARVVLVEAMMVMYNVEGNNRPSEHSYDIT